MKTVHYIRHQLALYIVGFALCAAWIMPAFGQLIDQTTPSYQLPSIQTAPTTFTPEYESLYDAFIDVYQSHSTDSRSTLFSKVMGPFITKTYNQTDYAKTLSQDGRHITDLLSAANMLNLTAEELYTGLRLFKTKLQRVEVIDDTVTSHILRALPSELEGYFPLQPSTQKKTGAHAQQIESTLLDGLTNHLQQPSQQLDQFLTDVSHKIAGSLTAPHETDEHMMRERLRQMVLRFVEQLISKTMWYPQHHEGIWQSFLNCAHNIHLLCDSRVINHMDDRDEIHWLLCQRFATFLDQYGAALPLSFYDTVESDLHKHMIPFLESAELDAGISPKKQSILDALAKGRIKADAFHNHGLIPSELRH